MVSAGSSAVTSMSSASRSFTARAYSARLRRWKLREPGAGVRAASASMRVSNAAAMSSSAVPSGRLAPAGGIIFARSLRIIFSDSSRSSTSRAASKPASDSPPALPRSLWQVAQVPA